MVKDHLGNEYKSLKAMLGHYNVSHPVYYRRQKQGLSLEGCLAPVKQQMHAYTDEDGITYPSIKEYCRKKGIKYTTFLMRKTGGYNARKPVFDHLGKQWQSKRAMYDHYGVHSSYEYAYKGLGLSCGEIIQIALAKKTDKTKQIVDHEGNIFSSYTEVCRHWHLRYTTFISRIRHNWDIKDAILKPPRKGRVMIPCEDHLGNKFPSRRAMAAHYGLIFETFRRRVVCDHMTIEQALTTPVKRHRRKWE